MLYGTLARALNQGSYCSQPHCLSHKNFFPPSTWGETAERSQDESSAGHQELVGQGKGINLTTVPHGPAATASRIHGPGKWNNWEVNLRKFYSPSLLSRHFVAFSLVNRDSFIPWLLSYNPLEVSHLKRSCCSSKCIWHSSVGTSSVIHQVRGAHTHLNYLSRLHLSFTETDTSTKWLSSC